MSKSSQLYSLMMEDFPTISYQKRLSYRTSRREVLALYKLINKEIFSNTLPMPQIEIMPRCRGYWGFCLGQPFSTELETTKSKCVIRVSDKWFSKHWLIFTLAHEMCHQYQWDIESKKRVKNGLEPIMSHGPTFFQFRKKLRKYNIPLRKSHSVKRWFRHQSLFKC